MVTEDGTEHPADTIILGTGFAATDFLAPMEVFGRDGVELSEAWRDGAVAHLGITVPGFPNLFLLAGPSTGLGHNSIVFMIEAQLRHVMAALDHLQAGRARGDRQAEVIEVRPEVAAASYRRSSDAWARRCGPRAAAAGTSRPTAASTRCGRASRSTTGGAPAASTPRTSPR